MVYVDWNPWRAGIVKRPGTSTYSSLRTHADLEVRPSDASLTRRLSTLACSKPIDDYTGKLARGSLTTEEYRSLLSAASGMSFSDAAHSGGSGEQLQSQSQSQVQSQNLLEQFGIDASLWRERMQSPGLFQSGAVGSPEARSAYASKSGKKWVVDKTRLWLKGNVIFTTCMSAIFVGYFLSAS